MTVSNEQIEAIQAETYAGLTSEGQAALAMRHVETLRTALAERDATIKRIQSAALSLADANTRASSARLDAAKRLEAECSPEHVESQRAANERLTNELAERDAEIERLTERLKVVEDEKLAAHVRFNNGILELDAEIERLKQELQTNRNARNALYAENRRLKEDAARAANARDICAAEIRGLRERLADIPTVYRCDSCGGLIDKR
jgi:predicted RNase H-like nuclease (RuvC/YqgF family)